MVKKAEWRLTRSLSTKRSLRLVLAEAGVEAALEAEEMTGKSINDLPEYFLSVFIALSEAAAIINHKVSL